MFKIIRFSGRFYVLVALGLSVLAGYGVAKITARVSGWRKSIRAGRLAALALVVLLLLEIFTFNLVVLPVPVWGDVPEVYTWLGEQGDVRVIDLPAVDLPASPLGEGSYRYDWRLGFNVEDTDIFTSGEGMLIYLSTYHWKEMANGYSGYLPFFYRRIMTEMQAFPSQRSVDLLMGLDIDYVIWHWDRVEEDERAEMEERLDSAVGLSEEQDFGEMTVFRVEQGSLASRQDLEISPAAPQAVPEGEGFNLSLIARNGSESPFVLAEEEPQTFHLSFLDASGRTVYEEEGTYPAPFFLEPGEETFLPMQAEDTPEAGRYQTELVLEGGVLGSHTYSMDMEVREAEELAGTGSMDGSVGRGDEPERIEIPVPDGLFPIVLEAENSGDVLWRSSWEEEQVGGHYPFGLVFLGITWVQDEEVVWEEQAGILPCDLSPGQSTSVPILVRPPGEPGTYELVIGLRDKDVGWFGGLLVLEAEIK